MCVCVCMYVCVCDCICVFTDFCSCLYDLFQHSVKGNLEAEDVGTLLGRLVSGQVLFMCHVTDNILLCNNTEEYVISLCSSVVILNS